MFKKEYYLSVNLQQIYELTMNLLLINCEFIVNQLINLQQIYELTVNLLIYI